MKLVLACDSHLKFLYWFLFLWLGHGPLDNQISFPYVLIKLLVYLQSLDFKNISKRNCHHWCDFFLLSDPYPPPRLL